MGINNQISIIFFVFVLFILYKIFKKEKLDKAKPDSCHLTEYERLIEIKTRKKWLISFMLMSLISVFSVFFLVAGEEGVESVSKEIGVLLGIVISMLAIVPWFWITYHCSFKKRGTAWLSWTMVMVPLRELMDISKGEWSDVGEWNALSWCLVLFFLGVEAYYLFNCFKLRKVNSIRKKIESDVLFKASAECLECVSKIENSQNLNDLNEIFGYAIRNWPQWEGQISLVYNKRKKCLIENGHL
jgi:hypothetical protein